jgi:hypothetical protein
MARIWVSDSAAKRLKVDAAQAGVTMLAWVDALVIATVPLSEPKKETRDGVGKKTGKADGLARGRDQRGSTGGVLGKSGEHVGVVDGGKGERVHGVGSRLSACSGCDRIGTHEDWCGLKPAWVKP